MGISVSSQGRYRSAGGLQGPGIVRPLVPDVTEAVPGVSRRWVWTALVALLLLPCLFFPGALPGPRVVSADDHLSVHHAWQEAPGGSIRHPQLSDPALQFKALRIRVVEALAAGRAPLWNPDLHGGRPLLASGQGMVGSPVTWSRLVLPEDSAQDFGVWFVLAWTALGTGLWLRALGAGPAGIAVGGAAAALGPYTWVWLLHPHAATFAFVPWLLWAIEARRAATLAVLCVGLVGGGHPETAAHGLLFAGAWALARDRSPRVLAGLIVGGLLSLPLWLPLAELLTRSATLGAHGGNTLAAAQLLDAVVPNFHGHPAGEGYTGPGVWADGVLHPGLAVLALAAWGARRSSLGRGLSLAWLGCLAGAIVGLPGPMNHARLAGMGALWLAAGAGLAVRGLPRWGQGLAWLAVLGTGYGARHLDQGSLAPERHDPAPAPWTAVLAAKVGDARVAGLGWALQPNTGALVGIRDLRGYDLPVPASWEPLARRLDGRLARPWYPIATASPGALNLMRFLGVRYLLSDQPVPRLEPLDVGPAPLGVYTLDADAPRAWFTTVTSQVPSADAGLDLVSRDRIARERPPVEGLTALRGTPAWAPLTLSEDRAWQVRVAVDQPSSGLVVLADTWDPHWVAQVDGEPAPVLRVGGYVRGVQVPAGTQEVVFAYAPWPWRWGLRGAVLGVLGWLGLLLWGRRR